MAARTSGLNLRLRPLERGKVTAPSPSGYPSRWRTCPTPTGVPRHTGCRRRCVGTTEPTSGRPGLGRGAPSPTGSPSTPAGAPGTSPLPGLSQSTIPRLRQWLQRRDGASPSTSTPGTSTSESSMSAATQLGSPQSNMYPSPAPPPSASERCGKQQRGCSSGARSAVRPSPPSNNSISRTHATSDARSSPEAPRAAPPAARCAASPPRSSPAPSHRPPTETASPSWRWTRPTPVDGVAAGGSSPSTSPADSAARATRPPPSLSVGEARDTARSDEAGLHPTRPEDRRRTTAAEQTADRTGMAAAKGNDGHEHPRDATTARMDTRPAARIGVQHRSGRRRQINHLSD